MIGTNFGRGSKTERGQQNEETEGKENQLKSKIGNSRVPHDPTVPLVIDWMTDVPTTLPQQDEANLPQDDLGS